MGGVMDKDGIINLLQQIVTDRGVPKNIKLSIEESIKLLQDGREENERISSVISILDEASNDPNISIPARTHIWNVVSILENFISANNKF